MGDFVININNAVQFQHLIWDRVMKHANVVVDATCVVMAMIYFVSSRASKKRLSFIWHRYPNKKAINSSQELLQSNDIAEDVD